jgi:hypothetical protein
MDASMRDDEDLRAEDLASLEDPQAEQIESAGGKFEYPAPLFHLRLDYSSESLYATHDSLELAKGDYVVVKHALRTRPRARDGPRARAHRRSAGRRGADRAQGGRGRHHEGRRPSHKEDYAFKVFREKVAQHRLEMKLIAAHYLVEEPKILFFFSSENRSTSATW